jgi:hypothetical protein
MIWATYPAWVRDAASAFTASSAPWWFVAALAGGLTVVSTVSGALIAFLSTSASDRRKATQDREKLDREEHRLDNRDLREAVARFLVETRGFVRAYFDSHTGTVQSPGSAAVYVTKPTHRPVDIRPAYEAYWQVVFLSDNEIAHAARTLLDATRAFDRGSVHGTGTIEDLSVDQAHALWASHADARGALARLILKQLGRENDIR